MASHLPQECYRKVFEFGCGTGIFTRMLYEKFSPQELTINDICPEMGVAAVDALDGKCTFVCGDAEKLRLPEGLTLIASCSAIQWFNDTEGFLYKCAQSLSKGGALAFSTFGNDNLAEIRRITGEGLNYLSPSQIEMLLTKAGFKTLACTQERILTPHKSPTDALRHLKDTGVTGLSRKKWTKGIMEDFIARYNDLYGLPDGMVTLTWNPIYIIALKR